MSKRSPTRGEALVASLVENQARNGLQPDAADRAVLDLIRSTADRIAALEALAADEGLTVPTGKSGVKIHPALVEARSLTLTLSRLLSRVDLGSATAAKDPTKQRAAQRRWELAEGRRR